MIFSKMQLLSDAINGLYGEIPFQKYKLLRILPKHFNIFKIARVVHPLKKQMKHRQIFEK